MVEPFRYTLMSALTLASALNFQPLALPSEALETNDPKGIAADLGKDPCIDLQSVIAPLPKLKQHPPGRITGRVSNKCARPIDYTFHPSASVCSGRTLLGLLVAEGRQCAALITERALICGSADREVGSHAVHFHHQEALRVA